jgi:hypothetical protein
MTRPANALAAEAVAALAVKEPPTPEVLTAVRSGLEHVSAPLLTVPQPKAVPRRSHSLLTRRRTA